MLSYMPSSCDAKASHFGFKCACFCSHKCRGCVACCSSWDVEERWQPLLSPSLLLEYEALLSRVHLKQRCPLPEAAREALIEAFLSKCRMVELHYLWRPNLRDEADNHVFELAVAAQDAALLT